MAKPMRAPGNSTSVGARRVALFIAYLNELPLRQWMDATHVNRGDGRLVPAEGVLRDALRTHARLEDVFHARDEVLQSLQRFDAPDGRWFMRGRGSTQDLRPQTENAALAVLVHDHLPPEQFAILYGAFTKLIPVTLLFGIDGSRG